MGCVVSLAMIKFARRKTPEPEQASRLPPLPPESFCITSERGPCNPAHRYASNRSAYQLYAVIRGSLAYYTLRTVVAS